MSVKLYRRVYISLSELDWVLLNIAGFVCVVRTNIVLLDLACSMELDDINSFIENVPGVGIFVEIIYIIFYIIYILYILFYIIIYVYRYYFVFYQ